ncbi:hypothetical protein K431DRAFT_113764 [Polychaeton citri CBS 116435]|uniref:Uncharacterized protein n=1 Tax=Polychaeton citri CBS 116435 TaxID=1314669 RepID=A0A9P4UMY8_9PEZI|nr:hypothetical protein K431DRAFT_113764 [Polychaeton citri CBS 116435]
MSGITSTLKEASEKNIELLTILSQTDYAPSAFKQNSDYISDLKNQLNSTEKELTKLHAITEDERKDHTKYRDSTMRRFAHRLGGSKGKEKFASKQEKEEREFLEAWQREREAEERKGELHRALSSAEQDRTGLQNDAEKQQRAQKELDEMYHSIFSGPTPDVPGEDQQEEVVRQAKAWLDEHQTQMNHDKYALGALQTAAKSLRAATATQMNITEGRRHIDEARRASPNIGHIDEIQLPHGHIMSDVLFDNIFTDMAQHDRIVDSDRQVKKAVSQLKEMIVKQDQVLKERMSQAQDAGKELEMARRELQRIRAEAFAQLTGDEVPFISTARNDEAPPSYTAV